MGFEIVLVDDKGDREKIRNHLRLVQSEQRLKRIKQRKQANVALRSKGILSHGPLAWRQKDSIDVSESSSESSSERPSRLARIIGSEAEAARTPVPFRPIHPATILSAARKDPFTTFPIRWDPEVDVLFDFREFFWLLTKQSNHI
jgi:hypothetical protein